MANIFSIFGQVFIDNEKANKSIDETTQKGKKSSKSFAESFMDVSKKAMQIGTAVVGTTTAIVGGLTAAANGTAQVADEIDKGSIRMGVSTKAYQELKYAAGQCGVEMSAMEKAAKKLEGTDINMEDAMNQIMALGTAEERATKASELFGDNIAYTLSPLIEQSADDYTGLIDRANELGLVMSEDSVNAGVVFGDTLSDLQQSFGAIQNNLMSAVIPILTQFMSIILDNMPLIQQMVSTLAPILMDLLNGILPVFTEFCQTILPIIFDLLKEIMPIITEIIQELLPIFTQLLKIILPPIIEIVRALLPALLPIIKALLPLLQPLLDLLTFAINKILNPIIKVISSIANVISKVLVGAIKALKPVVEGVKTVFEKVFGGLFNIVKAPINFIIDGINLFIKALNKIKIPDWVPAVGGKGINLPLIKKLRIGIDNIPYDEMPAILHKGEAVLNKEDAEEYRKNRFSSGDNIENNTFNNTIHIEHLETKNESDIKRIAEELYYLMKKEEV